jgi:ABC-type glycerol-3-phosphate transport system permease component
MKALRADAVKHVVVWIILILTYYPLVFSVETSLKSNTEFQYNVFGPTWPFYVSNYSAAWSGIAGFIWNTVVVAVVTVVFTLVLGSMAAFVFARYDFPGKRLVFYLFLGLLMIPSILTLIPLFLEIKGMHLLNNWLALILPYIAGGQAITVFVLQAFFSSLPEEMFEAARIDGASEFRIFWQVVIPLCRPALAAMGIFTFMYAWEDFFWPLIIVSDSNLYTAPLGLALFVQKNRAAWDLLFAGSVIATIPMILVFLFFQRQFIRGIALTGIKG